METKRWGIGKYLGATEACSVGNPSTSELPHLHAVGTPSSSKTPAQELPRSVRSGSGLLAKKWNGGVQRRFNSVGLSAADTHVAMPILRAQVVTIPKYNIALSPPLPLSGGGPGGLRAWF